MPRLLVAITLAALSASAAPAQVTGPPGSGLWGDACCFDTGLMPLYEPSRTPEQRMRDDAIERDYRASLRKIPDRKPSNDPWKNLRAAPPEDRHRPQ